MQTTHETVIFADRVDAGRQLAWKLLRYRTENPLVLALPRGGVVVGHEVAHALNAPLGIVPACKVRVSGHPDVVLGAIAADNVRVLDEDVLHWLHISAARLDRIFAEGADELERRTRLYRGGAPALDVRNRTVILVDDGMGTGMTAYAALLSLRQQGAKRVILAAPVCAEQTASMIREDVDRLVCLSIPDHFRAVGLWYRDFEPVTDEQVVSLLQRIRQEREVA
jgi:putative phosphoribosyl transferase